MDLWLLPLMTAIYMELLQEDVFEDLGTPDGSKEGIWTSCIPGSEITVSGSLICGMPATKHRKMVVRGCLVSSRFRLLFS